MARKHVARKGTGPGAKTKKHQGTGTKAKTGTQAKGSGAPQGRTRAIGAKSGIGKAKGAGGSVVRNSKGVWFWSGNTNLGTGPMTPAVSEPNGPPTQG